MARRRSATQRARMVARKAAATGVARITTLEDDADLEPSNLSGRVKGTDFDWQASLYLDPDRNALYDGGDAEAREIRLALAADWKMRQLAEVLTSSIKGTTWKLTPGKGDRGEAEDTEEKLRRPAAQGGMSTPIGRVIAQASSSIVFRRAYFAKGFKLDTTAGDGSVMYSQLAMRPASTCRLLRDPEDGSFDGFEQDIVYFGLNNRRTWDGLPVQFTPAECLVFINGQDRDPVSGVSDLEVALWCWNTKRKVMLLWLSFLQAQSLPRTLVKYKGGDEPAALKAAKIIASLAASGVGYFDATNMDVDTLDVSGRGPAPFVEMVKYLDSCASGSVLAGFTDLTSAAASGRGSFALSSDSRDMFAQTREHAAKELAETMTNFGVAPLVRHNYGPAGTVPTFTFDSLAGVDEAPLLQLLEALATAQSTVLPREFVNELAIHAARLLELDVDKVKGALEQAAKDAEEQAKAQASAVAAAGVAPGVAGANAAMGTVQKIAKQIAGAHPDLNGAKQPAMSGAGQA